MTLDGKWLLLGAASLALACTPDAGTASGNGAIPAGASAATPKAATGGRKVALSGNAGADAVTQAIAAAKRQGLSEINITSAQSFGLTGGGKRIGAILTGEAQLEGGTPGCFAAIVHGGRTSVVPTIGQGNYEAEACDKAKAVGILSQAGEVVRIGTLFAAYSPNAEVTEPIVLNWSPSTGALSIDDVRSRRASEAGARSIATMRSLAE